MRLVWFKRSNQKYAVSIFEVVVLKAILLESDF